MLPSLLLFRLKSSHTFFEQKRWISHIHFSNYIPYINFKHPNIFTGDISKKKKENEK